MEGANPKDDLIDDSRHLVDDSKKVVNDVQRLYDRMRRESTLADYYEKNPYAVLGAAAGVGYLLGGGLFTPFTRRLLKIGMKGLILPIASAQFKQLSAEGHPSDLPFEGER
ncbi:MAG: hypothetical protein ACOCV2_01665 [Persicimonas sp.]